MTTALRISVNAIPARFTAIASDAFGFDFGAYCVRAGGRVLYGFEIDNEQKRLAPLFGNPPTMLLEAANARSVPRSKAGYRVDVGAVFPSLGLNADVLLIASDLLLDSFKSLDAILLHEACHLVIDSGHAPQLLGLLDERANYAGDKLYRQTDRENEDLTKHSNQFCRFLAAGAQRLSDAYPKAHKDRDALIRKSMQFDVSGAKLVW